VTEEVTEKTQTTESAANTAPNSRGGLWIGIIVVLVIVLIVGAGFYFYQLLRAQSDDIDKEDLRTIEIAKQVTGFQTQLSAMQTQLTEATGTIANADDRIDGKLTEQTKTQEEKLEATRKELTTAIVQIQRQLGKTRGDWLLADAEYLLTVAGQRLNLSGDLVTAREALEAADQRLRESGDAAAIKVREQIAKELALLHAVPEIDLVGLYAKLDSLSERVAQLTLFLPYEGKQVVKTDDHNKHPASSTTSSDLLDSTLHKLDAYVTVRHTEQPIKAILTAEQAQFIRQQLSLKLEMIKLALVQKNQPLYHAGLTDALDWLDKHFNKNRETQQFIAELKDLDGVKLNTQLPDISLSLKMLRDIAKLRIETDKALPAVDLERKLDLPKVEAKPQEVKPVETKPAETVNKAEEVKPEEVKAEPVKTETAKPAAEKPAVNQGNDNKSEDKAEKPAATADKPVSASTGAEKTAAEANKTALPAVELNSGAQTTSSADKPAADSANPAKNSAKAPPPVVTKPVTGR
jgi:uroporphyrin-III C-methyltransferase